MLLRVPLLRVSLLLFLATPGYIVNGSGGVLPWPSADKIIQTMCPDSDICGINNTTNPKSCCEPCSCQDDCDKDVSTRCCFLNHTKADYETCMYPRSKAKTTYTHSSTETLINTYYVVTQSPMAGCVAGSTATCNTENESSMSLVYSTEKNKIYFNSECADCHGANDTIAWLSAIICDGLGGSKPFKFDQEMTKFLSQSSTSMCFSYFYLFGNVGINSRKCELHTSPSGKSMFKRPDHDQINFPYNVSIYDIHDACMSSFNAPVLSLQRKRWYPNPFCFLYEEGKLARPDCAIMSSNPSGVDYMLLLNTDITEMIDLQSRTTDNSVCFKSNLFLQNMEKETCRQVSCPVGHIYDRHGKCTFISSQAMYKGRFVIIVEVILKGSHDRSFNSQMLSDGSSSDLSKALQIPSGFALAYLAIPADAAYNNTTIQKDEVLIGFISQGGDSASAIQTLKSHLNKTTNIVLQDGKFNFTYEQKLYPLTMPFDVITHRPVSVRSTVYCAKEALQNVYVPEPDITMCWRLLIFKSTFKAGGIPIYKTYICDLVELMPGEFQIVSNGTVLYYELLKIYLYEKEFVMIENENGNNTVKICLGDSGFVPFVAKDGGEKLGGVSMLLICTFLMVYLI